MLGAWLIILFIAGLVFGLVGIAIAANKGVSETAGFFLGAFLGPIGLVIVALLSPAGGDQAPGPAPPLKSFVGERELSNDAYRLWLTSRYAIQRNDVLNRYVVGERLFPSIDGALHHASQLHGAEIDAVETEKKRLVEERERRLEEERQRQAEAAERLRRWRPYLIGGGAFCLVVVGYLITLAIQSDVRRGRIERARLAAEKVKQDQARGSINAALASYGIALASSANDAVLNKNGNCTYSANAQTKRIEGGTAAHFWTESYPPADAPDDVKRFNPTDWEDLSGGLYTLMVDAQRLFRNRKTGVEVLITADDETDYKSPGGSLSFKVKVEVCVGKVPKTKAEPAPVPEDSTLTDPIAEDSTSAEEAVSDSEVATDSEYYGE